MRAMGDRVTQDQTDPQYMFLRQRLVGLEEGWEELQRMWDNRQHLLSQGLNLQVSINFDGDFKFWLNISFCYKIVLQFHFSQGI